MIYQRNGVGNIVSICIVWLTKKTNNHFTSQENVGPTLICEGLTAPRHHHGPPIYMRMCAYYEGLTYTIISKD